MADSQEPKTRSISPFFILVHWLYIILKKTRVDEPGADEKVQHLFTLSSTPPARKIQSMEVLGQECFTRGVS